MKVKKLFTFLWPFLLLLLLETLLLFTTVDIDPYFFSLAFVLFFVFGLVHLILHETGHLVFGWATGYRFLTYRIFSHLILKENGKLTFKRQAINEAIAQCLMVPHKDWNATDYPYKLYLSGGVLLNAVSSLSALFLLNNETIPSLYVVMFSGIGLFLVLLNAVPRGMNDGAVLKKCSNNPAYRKMMYHQLRTVYYLTENSSLNNLPSESFELSNEVPLNDAFSLYVMRLEYYKYLEKFQFEKAAAVLEKQWQIRDELVPMDRLMTEAEKLFCLSIQQQSIAEAQKLYQQTEMQLIQKYEQITIKRIFATYFLFAEKDPAKGLVWIKAGLNLGNSNTFDNSLQVELNMLEWLQQKAQTELEQQ